MERKKLVIATAISVLMLLTIFSPMFITGATESSDWYKTVSGVLDTDTYLLYPYSPKSLKLGFSKFGELIDSNNNVGLEYANARDPFAAPAGASIDTDTLPKEVWINGWYIDIRYVHSDWGNRHVWAGALFADKEDYGKNWIRVDNNYTYPNEPKYEYQETFDDRGKELTGSTPGGGLVNGGRKTNGTAITDPIEVLYDGPRLFVAKCITHIYDWNEERDTNLHLVDVVLTIIFNKVKKEVIVLKDVKIVKQAKFKIDPLTVTVTKRQSEQTLEDEIVIDHGLLIQFSNREEWDLGKKGVSNTPDYSSYVHFYTAGTASNDSVSEGRTTDYNEDWTMLPTLPANTSYADVKVNAYGPEPLTSGTYDVAQIISNDVKYVGWHAFWPSLSDWSADAARSSTKTWYRAMTATDPHYIDSYGSEPFLAPLILGEWDFVLADNEYVKHGETTRINVTANVQFRGVSVYGVTDRHDASDPNKAIDSEVQYQLDEVFNPWDLHDVVEKQEYRWLYYDDSLAAATSYITLTEGLDDEIWCNKADLAWSGYKLQYSGAGCSARWVNAFENGSTYTAHSKNWALLLSANESGYARVRITPAGFGQNGTYRFGNLTEISFWYKTLTAGAYGPHIFVKLSNGTAGSEVNVQMYDNGVPTSGGWRKVDLSNIATFTGQTADKSFWYYADPWTQANKMGGLPMYEGGTLASFDFYRNKLANYYVTDIVVELGFNLAGSTIAKYLIDDINVGYLTGTDGIRYERVYNMEEDKLIPSDWDAYCSFAERVLINGTLIKRYGYANLTAHESYYRVDFETGTITFHHWSSGLGYHAWDLGIGTHIKVLYSTIEENEKGRYEWTTVGRNAASVDSVGAALVTAAFKNKRIEIGLAGADMYNPEIANQMPWVMAKFGTGNIRVDYYYSGTDYRTALKDDWCTTWPISSSNMMGIGGPLANLLAYYGNDFTDALFGLDQFTNYTAWEEKIIPLTCWNISKTRTYASSNITGYAVISTYKDINGTVIFLIWGHWGRDTFYVTKWFHEEGIYQLQEAPSGLTSIIVKITYEYSAEGYKPTDFSIVECLGTISETEWTHNSEVKGGIHDP